MHVTKLKHYSAVLAPIWARGAGSTGTFPKDTLTSGVEFLKAPLPALCAAVAAPDPAVAVVAAVLQVMHIFITVHLVYSTVYRKLSHYT